MYSMFYFFSSEVIGTLDLKFLDLLVFLELAILEWFFTWHFKHARINVCMYFWRYLYCLYLTIILYIILEYLRICAVSVIVF